LRKNGFPSILLYPIVSGAPEGQVHLLPFDDGHFPVSCRHLWRLHCGKWVEQPSGRHRRGGIDPAGFLRGHETSLEKRMS
jgi:hypothetical protein